MKIRRRVLVCVFLMGAQAIVGVGAVTNYWTGASSTNWHDAANWSEGVVPATGDDVVLSDSGLRPFLDQATPRMNSLMLDEGQTLTQLGWDSTLDAVNLRIDGTITHGVNPGETNRLGQWEPWHRILLAGSNITINGMLDANGRGFGRNAGPGRPTHSYGGGGYGTSGGWGFGGGYYSGGSEYGEPSAPWWPGSGGGPINTSRSGGGAIRVMADGHLEINGTLSANGVNGVVSHGGGGSGGGIWLHCRTFGGHETGRIRACGGNGQSCGGSGGGGRIAVHYDAQAQEEEPIPAVRFEAFAGKQGTDDRLPPKRQAMGSLFLTDNQWLQGDFTGGRFDHTKLVIPGMTTWTYAGDLCLDDCRIELDR